MGGWLELRKGYHTFLSPVGELVIVRDNVLRGTLQVMNPATTKNQLQQRRSRSGQGKSRKSDRSKPAQEIQQRALPPIEESCDELLNVAGLMSELPDLEPGAIVETVGKVTPSAETVERIADSEAPETGDVSTESRVMLNIRRVSEGPSDADWLAGFRYNSAALQSFSTTHFSFACALSNEVNNPNTIAVGPWIVTVSIAMPPSPSSSSASAAVNSFPLINPEDLLEGSFQYSLEIPCCNDSEDAELRILWTLIDSGEVDEDKYSHVKRRFRPLDQRLREGLPIFILKCGPEVQGTSSCRTLEATFCYHHYRYHNHP